MRLSGTKIIGFVCISNIKINDVKTSESGVRKLFNLKKLQHLFKVFSSCIEEPNFFIKSSKYILYQDIKNISLQWQSKQQA